MSDTGHQNTIVDQYRRSTLLSGIALFAMYVSAPASFASGGGGGDGGEQSDQTISSKKKPTVNISQSEFRSLSSREIGKYNRDGSGRKHDIIVNGFSPKMSDRLFIMAMWDRAATRRLLKDMSRLKTKEARKARLKKEYERTKKLEKDLKESYKALKKNKASTGAQYQEEQRLRHTKFYKEALWSWRSNPMEGTLK